MAILTKGIAPAILTLLLCSNGANSQPVKDRGPQYYTGPVRIAALRGTIDLADGGNPVVTIRASARNSASASQIVNIGFRGGTSTRLSANAMDTARTVALAPFVQRSGLAGAAQSIGLDLLLEINSLPIADPIDTVDIRIFLPPRVPALIRSSLPLQRDPPGNRISYRLIRTGLHLTTLTLVYTTGPVTLAIDKRISPEAIERAGPVTVTLTVRNLGPGEARDVSLQDNYDPRDFEGQGADFRLVAGKDNDRRLVWSRQIARLAVGETTSVSYTLSARLQVVSTSLPATAGVINHQLVGVSNKLFLSSKSQ